MNGTSIAIRSGVAATFLAFSGAVLGLFGEPDGPVSVPAAAETGSSYLILTSRSLRPALDSLGKWLDQREGTALVVSVEDLKDKDLPLCSPAATFGYLQYLCGRRGIHRLILAGNGEVLSLGNRDREPGVLRAPVGDLAEAWAFVERYRVQGWPGGPRAAGARPDGRAISELLLETPSPALFSTVDRAGRGRTP